MILYRTIGYAELKKLSLSQKIEGHCINKHTDVPVVCFFQEPFRWNSNTYEYLVCIEISKDDPRLIDICLGIYHVPADYCVSDIWNGDMGPKELKMQEYLLKEYSVSDVRSIEANPATRNRSRNSRNFVCQKTAG